MTSSIFKDHAVLTRTGLTLPEERFVVEPRQKDGAFCLKIPGSKGNRDDVYKKVFTLSDVRFHTEKGWAVRMRGQTSRKWNTLKSEGLVYA